jgi:hypothetical protein
MFEAIRRVLTARGFILVWFAIWLSALLTAEYYVRIERPAMKVRVTLHHDMVTGDAPYAYRYRVLTPYLAEGLARGLQQLPFIKSQPMREPLPYSELAFVAAYSILNFTGLFVLLWSLGALIRELFRYELALLGVAICAFLVGFTFRDHYYHPWSFWEGAYYALGLLLIQRKQYLLFSLVSIIGLLNRETSVFLLLAFLFIALPERLSKDDLIVALRTSGLRYALGNLVAWVFGFFILHYLIGYKPSTFTVETAIAGNRTHLWYALILNAMFIGFAIPLIVTGIQRSPPLIRRSALMSPAYLGLLLVLGYWWEIRYWITLLPILVPALVAALVAERETQQLQPPS